MCGSKKNSIEGVKINLNYIREDVESALSYASNINDPELTKKLTEIKDKASGVSEYITSRTDSKTTG